MRKLVELLVTLVADRKESEPQMDMQHASRAFYGKVSIFLNSIMLCLYLKGVTAVITSLWLKYMRKLK
jgi:hypothetical protein